MTRRHTWLLGLVLGLSSFGSGCGGDTLSQADAGAADGAADDAARTADDAGPTHEGVTYYEDLRPVLAEHCESCHVEGGAAPFVLDTYESAVTYGSRLVDVTRDRIMPPYLVDNSGSCQSYRDARWLSDEEIQTFADWFDGGMLMGDPTTPDPVVAPLPTLTGSIQSLDIGVDYAPDTTRSDDYRCFVVDLPEGGAVTGYDVHPGNTAIVHHVIVYEPTSDDEGAQARALDAAEDGPGYTCFGGATVNAFPVVLWAPGAGATRFPTSTGVTVEATRPVVVQIHYNTLGGTGTDHTTVDLQMASSSVVPAYIVPIINDGFALPPRMASVSSTDSVSLTELGGISPRVYGAFPHMHTLGRQLEVTMTRDDGTEECVVSVPRWDFNWQLAYWYETPFRVTSTDQIAITCTWNTTDRDETVTWGEGTQDEMCLNFFYVSL